MHTTRQEQIKQLDQHAQRLHAVSMHTLCPKDNRRTHFLRRACGLSFDFSRQKIDENALHALYRYATTCRISEKLHDLCNGNTVNTSEQRPALHTLLRGTSAQRPNLAAHNRAVCDTKTRLFAVADALHMGTRYGYNNTPITDIVHIGIGGSDLGINALFHALAEFHTPHAPAIHFVSMLDGSDLRPLCKRLRPDTTLFIVCSKSFTTEDTLANAVRARDWLFAHTDRVHAMNHIIGVSANNAAMAAFGIPASNRFPLWDWIGGRYSVWSAVGLAVIAAIGSTHFAAFLRGGHDCDTHVLTAPISDNLAVLHGLLAFWNASICRRPVHGIFVYDAALTFLPQHLEQLMMESLGKSVTVDDEPVEMPTGAIIIGGIGTKAQHSYFQLFHQGTHTVSVDFLLAENTEFDMAIHASAQSTAFTFGNTRTSPHKHLAGGVPNSTVLLEKIDPYHLGVLFALFEHSVFVQSVCMDINPFDQWGVETGKTIAKQLTKNTNTSHNAV